MNITLTAVMSVYSYVPDEVNVFTSVYISQWQLRLAVAH